MKQGINVRSATALTGLLAATIAAPQAFADCACAPATPPVPSGWTGTGGAGVLIASGNTQSTAANAKLDIAKVIGDWKDMFDLAFLYGKNAQFATAQRIEGKWETDYALSSRTFVFGALDGQQDKFSGFQYQASVSTGIGYKVFDTDATKLSTTVGVGFRRSAPQTLVKAADGEVQKRTVGAAQSNAIGTFGVDFAQVLTQSTKLLDKLAVESGSANTSVANDVALQVNMSSALALSLGYGVRYNTNPAPGAKRYDGLTTINLVYNIK